MFNSMPNGDIRGKKNHACIKCKHCTQEKNKKALHIQHIQRHKMQYSNAYNEIFKDIECNLQMHAIQYSKTYNTIFKGTHCTLNYTHIVATLNASYHCQ